jgi:hypothetical protein
MIDVIVLRVGNQFKIASGHENPMNHFLLKKGKRKSRGFET